jgi:hypothetical protein
MEVGENWSMIKIEDHPCSDKLDASKRERYWYETLIAKLNMVCPIISKTEVKEYQKDYREQNKEQICIQRKDYREKNKEQVSISKKLYAEKNKDKIKEYMKHYAKQNKELLAKKKKEYRDRINLQKLYNIANIGKN